MIYQPLRGALGRAAGIEIQATEILFIREVLNTYIAEYCDEPKDKIEADCDRDFFMTAEEAGDMGLLMRLTPCGEAIGGNMVVGWGTSSRGNGQDSSKEEWGGGSGKGKGAAMRWEALSALMAHQGVGVGGTGHPRRQQWRQTSDPLPHPPILGLAPSPLYCLKCK